MGSDFKGGGVDFMTREIKMSLLHNTHLSCTRCIKVMTLLTLYGFYKEIILTILVLHFTFISRIHVMWLASLGSSCYIVKLISMNLASLIPICNASLR